MSGGDAPDLTVGRHVERVGELARDLGHPNVRRPAIEHIVRIAGFVIYPPNPRRHLGEARATPDDPPALTQHGLLRQVALGFALRFVPEARHAAQFIRFTANVKRFFR